MKKVWLLLAMMIVVGLLVGCGTSDAGKGSGEAAVVESFYRAIIAHDRDVVGTLVCADWEKDGKREVDAFAGTTPELVDFKCSVKESGVRSATVTCEGKIAASYGAEITDFPLSDRVHMVVLEGSEWRVCGFE